MPDEAYRVRWHFWLHPLRGLAAVLVVLLHSYWTWSLYDNAVVRKLYLMVDFFFVLSGFVISSGYFSKIVDASTLQDFIRRRIDRLHFQYILSGVAWLAAALLFGLYNEIGDTILSVLRYLLFIDFLFSDNIPRINPVAWSVTAEIWVYVSFGAVTLLIRNRAIYKAAMTCMTLLLSAALVYLYRDMNVVHGGGPVLRAFVGFYMGALCYQTFVNGWSRYLLLSVAVGQIALSIHSENYDLLSVTISALVLLFFYKMRAPNHTPTRKFLIWLGDISYPLYLWHFLIAVVLSKIATELFGGTSVMLHGEKFAAIPTLYGDLFCFLLLAGSLAAAQGSIVIEKKYHKGLDRLRRRATFAPPSREMEPTSLKADPEPPHIQPRQE